MGLGNEPHVLENEKVEYKIWGIKKCPASDLPCINPVLHLTCPASELWCI